MEEALQQRVSDTAQRVLDLANAMFRPQTPQELEEINQLRADGVVESQIASLYSLGLQAYASGIAAMLKLDDMDQFADGVSSLGFYTIQAMSLIREEYQLEFEKMRFTVGARELLRALALARIASQHQLDELLESPDPERRRHRARYIRDALGEAEVLFQEMRKRQRVSEEPDPLKRFKLRMEIFPASYKPPVATVEGDAQ